MGSSIQQLAQSLGLSPIDDATASFNASIKEGSPIRGWEWLKWSESLVSLLIDVLHCLGVDILLSREQIFQQAVVANPQLMHVDREYIYITLKVFSNIHNARKIFIERVYDGTCYYGLVNGYSEKLEYARLEVFKSFKKLSTDHKIEIVTNPYILKFLEMHPILIDLFVSRLYDLADKEDKNETEAMRKCYMLHIHQQVMKNDKDSEVYSSHASALADRYPEFRPIYDKINGFT